MLGLCDNLSTLRTSIETSMPRVLSLGNEDFLYEKLTFLLYRHNVSIIATLNAAVFPSSNYSNGDNEEDEI